jgi:lysozyme family protein
MADFKLALALALGEEGKYSNASTDLGGETYCGISRNENPKWEGWAVVDKMKTLNGPNFPACLDDNAELKTMVENFYHNEYWVNINGDNIKSQSIADYLFQWSINTYWVEAVKGMQLAMGVEPTGHVGDITLATLNGHSDNVQGVYAVMHAMSTYQVKYYVNTVKAKPEEMVNLRGWIDRVLETIFKCI